jgi:hypothetical protein
VDSVPMPPACEPLIACCGSVSPDYRRTECYDWLDGPREDFTVDGCPVLSTNFKEYFECAPTPGEDGAAGEGGGAGNTGEGGAGGASEAGAAGTGDGPLRVRCCYQTCGYTHFN